MFGKVPETKSNRYHTFLEVHGGSIGPMDYIHDIKPVVNYRFELIEGPLIKGQFSQLAIGVDTSSFQFWKLDTPLINLI